VFANAAFFTERLEELVANAGPGPKCITLDAEPISDFAQRRRRRWRIWMRTWNDRASTCRSRANTSLPELLTTTGLMKRLGAEHAYPSVRAAADAYHAQFGAS